MLAFLVPGKVYSTPFRLTVLGISVAAGKVDASIAQALIMTVGNKIGMNKWLNRVTEIYALFTLCGIYSVLGCQRMSIDCLTVCAARRVILPVLYTQLRSRITVILGVDCDLRTSANHSTTADCEAEQG